MIKISKKHRKIRTLIVIEQIYTTGIQLSKTSLKNAKFAAERSTYNMLCMDLEEFHKEERFKI